MDAKSFRRYLERGDPAVRRRGISPGTAIDYASRCKRFEKLLHIDLDEDQRSLSELRRALDEVPGLNLTKVAKYTMILAVTRYCHFRKSL